MENKNWKNLSVIQTIKSNMGILAGLVILCVVLSFTTSSFATVTNLFNVVRQITINLFLACGMTFVILLAGIDLSVGSVMALYQCRTHFMEWTSCLCWYPWRNPCWSCNWSY